MNKNSRKRRLEGNEEPRGSTKKSYRTGRKMNKNSRKMLLEENEEPRGDTNESYRTGRKMNKNSRKMLLEGNEESRGDSNERLRIGRKMKKNSRKMLLEGDEESRGGTNSKIISNVKSEKENKKQENKVNQTTTTEPPYETIEMIIPRLNELISKREKCENKITQLMKSENMRRNKLLNEGDKDKVGVILKLIDENRYSNASAKIVELMNSQPSTQQINSQPSTPINNATMVMYKI
jgi:hypothetical protein